MKRGPVKIDVTSAGLVALRHHHDKLIAAAEADLETEADRRRKRARGITSTRMTPTELKAFREQLDRQRALAARFLKT